ncbi:MAG: Xaa-Pro peptidase family protein [Phycisphaerae bacterium]|nr:Xaa-Pro peptidase family protein [Phycisphaerae bacterium]
MQSKSTDGAIPLREFADRRERVLKALKNCVGFVFAGDADPSLSHAWRPHPHFEYLTGIVDEPGAVVLLDPLSPVPARRVILFLKPLNPELEQWDGYRETICQRLRDRYGAATVMRTTALPRWGSEAIRRAKHVACLHPFAAYNAPVSPDLALFREASHRIPGLAIEDRTQVLAELRAKKSAAEQDVMRRAAAITAAGYDAVVTMIRPGITEFDVQETLEHAYRSNGARGPAYNTIAGTGFNATVLHYHRNDQPLQAGELIVIDSAAGCFGYSADVTRTYPVSGTFSKRQKEIYEIVLKSELAGIAAAKAGATFAQVDKAARDIITKAGYGDYFIHGIGHHLGLETHDITPDGPLPEGAVITVEPGIYLPDEKLGVRIEDDVLIGKGRSKVLTAMIPKTVAEIEKCMQGKSGAGRTRRVTGSRD